MKGTIKLSNPITVNGLERAELKYDSDKITAQMFAEADARKLAANGSRNGNAAGAAELDYGLHLYLGFQSIAAENPDIDLTELERIRGNDVMKVMYIGRDFISGPSEGISDHDNSDAPSETMPEHLTLQSDISEE